MKRRMAVVLLAVAGLLVSAYLTLYKLGFYGGLACGADGACARVQASPYAMFLGLPVAGWGVAWYAAVAAVGLWGLHRRAGAGSVDWPGRILFLLAAGGLLFSAYLTGLEAFVIEAWCRWCLVSAAITGVIFLLALPEIRSFRR